MEVFIWETISDAWNAVRRNVRINVSETVTATIMTMATAESG